jgi:hypothetical protein
MKSKRALVPRRAEYPRPRLNKYYMFAGKETGADKLESFRWTFLASDTIS